MATGAAVRRASVAAESQLSTLTRIHDVRIARKFSASAAREWPIKTLREICKTNGQYGVSSKGSADETGVAILRMGNLYQGEIRWENLQFVQLPRRDVEKYALKSGDLVFNRTNSAELVGKTAVFNVEREAVFASYLIRFDLDRGLADPDFVSSYINSEQGRRFIERNMARAVGQVNISASTMHGMPVPLPPLEVQKRIASELTSARGITKRALRSAREALHALDQLPRTLRREVFRMPER